MVRTRHAAIAVWLVACAVRSPQYEGAQGPPVYGDPSQGAEPQMSESFPSGTSQAPQTYSLDLKNECAETVDLFMGERPPYSSGTYTSLGSNTSTSYSGFAPETIWIVDDSRNPVSSYSIGPGPQRVLILESCTGFAPE